MGFAVRGFVFADDNPSFTGEDLNAALETTKSGRTCEVIVSVSQGQRVRVAVSKVETVSKREGPKGLDVAGDSRVSDWRFEGRVSDFTSKLNGQVIRGYAVGGYNTGGEEDIVDLYIQTD